MGTTVYQLRSLKIPPDFSEIAVIFQKESDILIVGRLFSITFRHKTTVSSFSFITCGFILHLLTLLGFETRIVRECGFLNTTMNCQKMGMNDVSGQFMCSCSEDGCNSSSQLTPKMAFLSLLTMVVGSTFRP